MQLTGRGHLLGIRPHCEHFTSLTPSSPANRPVRELVIPTLQPKIRRPAPGPLPQQVRLASKLPPGSVGPCSRHPRGLQPSPGASGQCAGSCLFIHFPRQPSCLRSGHTMEPVFWSPLPHPGTKGTEVEREVATGLPISSGKGEEQSRGNSGKSFSKISWRQGSRVSPASHCTLGS